jgi:hypothetical protein
MSTLAMAKIVDAWDDEAWWAAWNDDNCTYDVVRPPVAEACIAAWTKLNDPKEPLYIHGDVRSTALPPLPPTLLSLQLTDCPALATLPPLPATLTILSMKQLKSLRALSTLPLHLTVLQCVQCPALKRIKHLPQYLTSFIIDDCAALQSIPSLPPMLEGYECANCPALTVAVPNPPPTLEYLWITTADQIPLPDKLPPALRVYVDDGFVEQAVCIRRQHATARMRTAAFLPPAAALYV